MATLSKSKLIAYRQCPKRLWLEIRSPMRGHNPGTFRRGRMRYFERYISSR